MALSPRNLNRIRNGSASSEQLYEALRDITEAHNQLVQQINGNVNGAPAPPRPIQSLVVNAQDGIFHAQITDNGANYRGINYHLQYATDPSFSKPVTVHLGPSRDYRAQLGNQSLYWRGFSDYPTSAHSDPVYHGGSSPALVIGGGSIAGPTIPPGQGSGTGQPGQISGHGPVPFRSSDGLAPKRQ